MLGRRSKASSCAEFSFSKPETQEVAKKFTEIQAQVTQGSFIPDRENDILIKALGNKEHPSRTWGIGSKVPWKEGFPNDVSKYKSHNNVEQRRREEFKVEFKEFY